MFFPHCPLCRGRMKQKTPKLFVCGVCGYHFFDDPHAVNAVIFEDARGRILLVKRKVAPRAGFWDFPGGFLEQGETLEASVRREIKEELGIEIKKFRYFASYPDRYAYKGVVYPTLNCVFTARLPRGAMPVADDDAAALEFFPKNNIPWKKLAFKSVDAALKDWL